MAADIISAQPIGNVELEVYDFQQTLIEKALTDISELHSFILKANHLLLLRRTEKSEPI